MIVTEPGPGRVFVKLRELTGIDYYDDGAIRSRGDWTPLYCVWCTSLWVALIMMWLPLIVQVPLAVSAVAIVIHERLTQ